jgi:hypothetical protein
MATILIRVYEELSLDQALRTYLTIVKKHRPDLSYEKIVDLTAKLKKNPKADIEFHPWEYIYEHVKKHLGEGAKGYANKLKQLAMNNIGRLRQLAKERKTKEEETPREEIIGKLVRVKENKYMVLLSNGNIVVGDTVEGAIQKALQGI